MVARGRAHHDLLQGFLPGFDFGEGECSWTWLDIDVTDTVEGAEGLHDNLKVPDTFDKRGCRVELAARCPFEPFIPQYRVSKVDAEIFHRARGVLENSTKF